MVRLSCVAITTLASLMATGLAQGQTATAPVCKHAHYLDGRPVADPNWCRKLDPIAHRYNGLIVVPDDTPAGSGVLTGGLRGSTVPPPPPPPMGATCYTQDFACQPGGFAPVGTFCWCMDTNMKQYPGQVGQ